MKKIILALLLSSTFVHFSKAQTDPVFTQYLFNPMVYNPAYTGAYDFTSLSLISRAQWIQNPYFSLTNNVSIQSTFPNTEKAGAGLMIQYDKFGLNNNLDIRLAGSYKLTVSDYTTLSFGLQGFYTNYRLSNNLTLENPNDPNYTLNNNITTGRLNFGAGLYLLNPERYYLGISTPRIMSNQIEEDAVVVSQYNTAYYLSGGMVFGAGGNMPIRPSFIVRYSDGQPLSYDATCSVLLSQYIWAGASVRSLNTVGLIGQIDFTEYVRVGFSYDLPIRNNILVKTYGTFEATCNINFAMFGNQTVIQRYF